jgi:hypothetical protein
MDAVVGVDCPATKGTRKSKIRTKCGLSRTKCVRVHASISPESSDRPVGEPESGLYFSDLGAADRNPMRRWAIQFNDRAVAFLADQAHMRKCHDMAAVHPKKQAGVEMRLGFRDRPRAHPLPDPVMDLGIMCVGPDAAYLGGVDKMCAVSTFDRQSGCRCGLRRLADATKRYGSQPRSSRSRTNIGDWRVGYFLDDSLGRFPRVGNQRKQKPGCDHETEERNDQ